MAASCASNSGTAESWLTPKRIRSVLFAILLVAFAIRAAGAVWWCGKIETGGPVPEFHFGDSGTYWYLARQVADGEPYQYGSKHVRVFRTPGYPVMLAPLFLVSDNPTPLWASMINVLLGTITVGLLFLLASEIFDARVGLVAAALCAIYPGAIGMSIFVLSEGPFCPLMILHLWCWVRALREESFKRSLVTAAIGGIICGLAILVRPSWLLFVPFAGGLLFLFVKQRVRTVLLVVAMLIGVSITMLPWWIRNYQVTGHFVPTTLQTGSSLYDGLHAGANGSSDMSFAPLERWAFVMEQKETLKAPDAFSRSVMQLKGPQSIHFQQLENEIQNFNFEYEFDKRLKELAVVWAKSNPSQVARLACRKLLIMWAPLPTGNGISNPALAWVIALGYVPLIIAAVWGLMRFWRRGPTIWLCAMPAIYFSALHMIFVASIRYRQPAMLALLVLAAAAVCWKAEHEKSVDAQDAV